jgi:hypothetical protein
LLRTIGVPSSGRHRPNAPPNSALWVM